MKQFREVLNKENDWFKNIRESFQSLSEEKLKNGIFDGTEIRKMKNDKMKEHYLGRWDVNMMAGLLRETVQMLNTQGSQGRENFFLS